MHLGVEGVCCGVDELASSCIAFASAGLALFGGRLFELLNWVPFSVLCDVRAHAASAM